jgi:hypothetical protein
MPNNSTSRATRHLARACAVAEACFTKAALDLEDKSGACAKLLELLDTYKGLGDLDSVKRLQLFLDYHAALGPMRKTMVTTVV